MAAKPEWRERPESRNLRNHGRPVSTTMVFLGAQHGRKARMASAVRVAKLEKARLDRFDDDGFPGVAASPRSQDGESGDVRE